MNRPRGAVFVGPGQPLVMQDFDYPALAAEEALVEVLCCTLCGSDLHTIQGKREVAGPMILGHEVIGRLVETSGDLRAIDGGPLRPGDRISWGIAASCDDCFFCQSGLPQKCEKLFKYGHQTITSQAPLSGGLATHCHLVPGTRIIKVPDSLPDVVACPANCATATVVAAARIAGACEGKTVAIFGAGMLGLTAAALFRSRGAADVILVDIDPKRLEQAAEFGATSTRLAEIGEMTGNRGCDLALEMSGSTQAVEQALASLRIGGRLILVGSVFPTEPLSIRPEDLVRRMIRIEGLHNYAPIDLQVAIEFLEAEKDRFPFESLVSREYVLSNLQDAVRHAVEERPIRISVRPS
ncbi:MAG: zinc-binding dehydrogenase [Mariniblastus sp.]|nr:zinc-binding dehydrogenase [Mariniblastus sp.]